MHKHNIATLRVTLRIGTMCAEKSESTARTHFLDLCTLNSEEQEFNTLVVIHLSIDHGGLLETIVKRRRVAKD